MKIITCAEAKAAMHDDPDKALAYAVIAGRMIADLEAKYAAAGEPVLRTAMTEAQRDEMSGLMHKYGDAHPHHPMRAAVRSAYFAMRAVVFASPALN